jgi:hypothetical protein
MTNHSSRDDEIRGDRTDFWTTLDILAIANSDIFLYYLLDIMSASVKWEQIMAQDALFRSPRNTVRKSGKLH